MRYSWYSDLAEFVKDHKVVKFELNERNDQIIIRVEGVDDKYLCLYAVGDCCSESWFETLEKPFATIIDKVIKTVGVVDGVVNLEFSERPEYDQNYLVRMEFEGDSEPFEFVLRNSSNGYYDGWLEMSIISC